MIKCIGYLKSLKQLLSILLISCFIFGLGSFASAVGTYQEIGLNSYPSVVNANYDVNFLKGGGLMSTYLGQGKGVLALDNNILFWWLPDGLPYYYGGDKKIYGNIVQGYFPYYSLCSSLVSSGGDYQGPTNCSTGSLDDSSSIYLKNFFSSLKAGDIVNYNLTNDGGTYWWYGFSICFNSSEFNKSLCFNSMYNYENNYSVEGQQLINSRSYDNLTFAGLPYSEIGRSPGQAGYMGGGSSEGSINTEITIGLTGDYSYSSCTQGEILGMLENQGFSKYMCFGGLDNFDLWSSTGSYSPIPGTGKRLSQILSYSNAWDSPQQWFEYWNGLYQDKDNPLYFTMWESYPAVYRTWFDMYSKYGNNKYFDSIREYCVMKVDLTLNPDLVYNGTQFKGVCDSIIDIKQNPQYYTTDSGGRIVGVNWVGVGQLSGNSKNATQFIQDFFNIIKAQINTNYDGPGFIPAYIILFMLALIFFRFISH